jgi:hypothetical protein
MGNGKRMFIFGAGFSRPAGIPVATNLLPLLVERTDLDEMRDWLGSLCKRLAWLCCSHSGKEPYKVNIEQIFHYGNFDIEVFRLRQHMEAVGRNDGPGTVWNTARSIEFWLGRLEDALRDVICETETTADLMPITRWAHNVGAGDSAMTFNYDTLVERALAQVGKAWNHGIGPGCDDGVPVFKLHGSIDWIVAHRFEPFAKLDLLFDKQNENRSSRDANDIEDACCTWRCQTRDQLEKWVAGREPQLVPDGALPKTVGIAGLGAYKQLHQIPGLGLVWARAMRRLYECARAVVVGFSMSDFDAMAQMQFAEVASKRIEENRPMEVTVIDPCLDEETKRRFVRVFRNVRFEKSKHETFDWACC